MSTLTETRWELEVVRGKGVGRCYPLAPGRSVLGNALGGDSGIDLGGEEGASPRRMAARQAEIVADSQALSVRDLESPGGTFVNSQRVLAGQSRSLRDGDLIQLAGVQLRVVSRAPVAAVGIGPLVTPYHTASGTTCRTWDDFLTASSKDWTSLREELVSGRISTFLRSIGRDDLLPTPPASKTDDERLDAWLGRLPVSRPLEADMDVHPSVLRIRASLPGTTRRSVSITNTGYRLLRSTLKIEPATTDWLRIAPPFGHEPFTTAETTEFQVEITTPDTMTEPRVASVIVESNAGLRTLAVHLDPPAKLEPEPPVDPAMTSGAGLGDWLASFNPAARVFNTMLLGLLFRVLLSAGDVIVPSAVSPGLAGSGLLFAGLGALVGLILATRAKAVRDAFPAAFAGAFAGLFLASIAVAACRAVEPWIGIDRGWTAWTFWVLAGGVLAVVSLWVRPYRTLERETSR
jgi:FHA domain